MSLSIDPIIVVRGVHFAATVLAAGTVSFMTLVADVTARLRRQLVVLTWAALATSVVTGAAWLALLTLDLTGELTAAWTVLGETRFGAVAIARLVLAAALAVLIVVPRAWALSLAAAAAFLALLAFVGHAGAASGILPLVADALHLLAAGAWLGGLPALALLLAQDGPKAPAAVRRFGQLGLLAVAVLAATGLFNAWNLLASPRDLVATNYGRLLLAKLALVAAMLAFAAVNRFRLTARATEPHAQRQLQRNSLAETALGLGVLLLVGALGTLPPTAHRHAASEEIPPDTAFVHIHDGTAMADVSILPGRVGSVIATIRVSREDGSEFPASKVQLALAPPKHTALRIDQQADRQADGSWTVRRLEIEQAGNWTVRVTVTPSEGAPFVLDAPVVIEP